MTRKLTLYLRHREGATHAFEGRRLSKLLAELKAGRGGPELTALAESGYTCTLGGLDLGEPAYEALLAEAQGRFGTD